MSYNYETYDAYCAYDPYKPSVAVQLSLGLVAMACVVHRDLKTRKI